MKSIIKYSFLRNFLLCIILLIPTYVIYSLEDDLDMDSYKLPSNAVLIATLQVVDDQYIQQDKPFTGVAYERYSNNQLKKVIYIHKGLRSGPTYAWYTQGQKMMYADYKNGKLDGQFYGWYAYGAVMYNLIYKDGRLDSDSAFLENDDRSQQGTDTKKEGEGEVPMKEGD